MTLHTHTWRPILYLEYDYEERSTNMTTIQNTDKELWGDLAFYVLVQARHEAPTLGLLPDALFITTDDKARRLWLTYDAQEPAVECYMEVLGNVLARLSEKAMRRYGSMLVASIARKL